MARHVCTWWHAYLFDNFLRWVVHKPRKLFGRYVDEGMTVMDVGCGMGIFSIGMAKMVGESGRVISIDMQQQMLDVLRKRAGKAGVAQRISAVLCEADEIGVEAKCDFILAFWMIHEVADPERFFRQIRARLKPGGKLLVAEPKFHVSPTEYRAMLKTAQGAGFKISAAPRIPMSRGAVLAVG